MQTYYENNRFVREDDKDQNKVRQAAPNPRDARGNYFSREHSEKSQLTDTHPQRVFSQERNQFYTELLLQIDVFYATNPTGKAENCFHAHQHLLKQDENNLGNFVSSILIQLSKENKDKNKESKFSRVLQHIPDLVHCYANQLSSTTDRQINENKYISTIIHRLSQFRVNQKDPKINEDIETLVNVIGNISSNPTEQAIANTIYGLGKLAEAGIKLDNIEPCIAVLLKKLSDDKAHPKEQEIANMLWGLAHYREVSLDQNLLTKLLNYVSNNLNKFSNIDMTHICIFLASRKLPVPSKYLTKIKVGADKHPDSSLKIEVFNHLSTIPLNSSLEREKVILFKPVDFYIELNNGKRKIILEVDGSHHDHPTQKNIDAFLQELFEDNGYEVVRVHHQEWHSAVNKQELLLTKLKVNQYATLPPTATEAIVTVNKFLGHDTTTSIETHSSTLSKECKKESQNASVMPKQLFFDDKKPLVSKTIIGENAIPTCGFDKTALKVDAKSLLRNKELENKDIDDKDIEVKYNSLLREIGEMVFKGEKQYGDTFKKWYEENYKAKASGKDTVFVRAQNLFDNHKGIEALDKLITMKKMIAEKLKGYELNQHSTLSEIYEVIKTSGVQESLQPILAAKLEGDSHEQSLKKVFKLQNGSKNILLQKAQYFWGALFCCCSKKPRPTFQAVVEETTHNNLIYKKTR